LFFTALGTTIPPSSRSPFFSEMPTTPVAVPVACGFIASPSMRSNWPLAV